jgi:hypothetical protein
MVTLPTFPFAALFAGRRWRSLAGIHGSRKRNGSAMSEDSLGERATAAAEERLLSENTLTAYRRTWGMKDEDTKC